jgi:Gram-negative bacterial TonB protein C-terminal
MNHRTPWSNVYARNAKVLILLASTITGPTMASAQSRAPLPAVIRASVPLYPRVSQVAHIEGVVRLRISTDGHRVSTVQVESGPQMLAQAAKENAETWQFEQHNPTTFDATFHYQLLPSTCDSKCNCGSKEGGSVLLRLPMFVEVKAEEVLTCDPEITKKP